MARDLIRISWLATATNAETLPIRSPSSVASASRYASASAPSGTVRTSSWRASISASSSASGPSKAGSVTSVAASGRRPSPNATDGRSRRAVIVSRPRPRRGTARRTPGRAGRPGGGRGPRHAAAARPPASASADASAWSRSRSSAAPPAGDDAARAPGPTARTASPSDHAIRGPAPVSPLAQSWSRPAASTSRSRTPARRRYATTSRPWRRSATCWASNRASSAGVVQAASIRRSSGLTLAVRCVRSWRALAQAHQDVNATRKMSRAEQPAGEQHEGQRR